MEFVPVATFHHPDIPLRLKIRRQSSQIRVTSCLYVSTEEALYAGLSNGQIFVWRKRSADKPLAPKECDLINISDKDNHKGDVTCLVYEEKLYEGIIVSGSADSKIKIWVKDLQNKTKNYACKQTLVEHQGTILSVAISSQHDLIATSSTDQTIKIWRQQPGRELLLFPFYVCVQTLTDHIAPKHLEIGAMGVWVTSIIWKEGDELQLLAGDSEGTINIYKPREFSRDHIELGLEKKSGTVHRLIISKLILVPQENFVFSISFDQYFKGLDATNGSEFVNVRNTNRCYFTALLWDNTGHELIVADEMGYVGVWNVYHEKPIFWERVFDEEKKIIWLALRESKRELIVATETVIQIFFMRRGQSSHDIQGHDGPVLKIHAQEAHQIHRLHSNNKPRFITASIDNTIKVWDFSDLQVICSMTAPMRAEISCMCFLSMSSLIATGHENGTLMLWNPEINEKIKLKCDPGYGHNNTVSGVCQALFKDIEYLISIGYDSRICIWEITERTSALRQAADGSAGITVFPSLRNSFLTTQHKRFTRSETGDELLCVTYDSIRGKIVVGGNSTEIQLWDMQSLDYTGFLQGHIDSVISLCIEQNFLFSGSDDRSIRIWDLENIQPLYVLHGHTMPVHDLLIIPESGHLISCSHDGKILIWSTETHEIVKTVERADHLNCLAFLSIQNILMVGTEESTIITVPIEPIYGNPYGLDHTVNKAQVHMDKKIRMKRGENVEFSDDTRSIASEDILEEYPDPAEEHLKEMFIKSKSKEQ